MAEHSIQTLARFCQNPDDMPTPPEVMPALLAGMATRARPEIADHSGSVVGWTFDDGSTYHLTIGDGGRVSWADGPAAAPRAVFRTTLLTWLQVVTGELDGTEAFTSGRLRIEGDV